MKKLENTYTYLKLFIDRNIYENKDLVYHVHIILITFKNKVPGYHYSATVTKHGDSYPILLIVTCVIRASNY